MDRTSDCMRSSAKATFIEMSGQPLATRLQAALFGLLVLGATVAPPLLDAGERPGEVRVESEHDPGRCAVLHDHAACAQLAKSFAIPGDGAPIDTRIATIISGVQPRLGLDVDLRAYTPSPAPRAPPIPRN